MRSFRLASLLRLRSAQEDQAAAALAREAAARLAASQVVRGRQHGLAGHRLPDQGTNVEWTASVAARAALSSAHRDAVDTFALAQERVSEAESTWGEARQRTRSLEHLAEVHAAAAAKEGARREQLALDEHASRAVSRRPAVARADADGDPS